MTSYASPIGNRLNATVNGRQFVYSPNLLNQYDQRTVPAAVDVTGTAVAGTTVTVTQPGGVPHPATRQGTLFYTATATDNSQGPQAFDLTVTAVKNLVGANGEDAIMTGHRQAFVPQTPEIYTYDADGSLTQDGRWTYEWDAENRLSAMQTLPGVATTFPALNQRIEFAYDTQGRRITKKVSNYNGGSWVLARQSLYLYDGWNMVAELDALNGNALLGSYGWGVDLSGTLQGAGGVGGLILANTVTTAYAPEFDGNGNITAWVEAATGSTAGQSDYGPFGEPASVTGIAATMPFGFSTKYTDPETGLLYYGLRYYSPATGRWLSRDPIQEEGGVNLFGFVGNNSINRIDQLGLYEIDVHYYLTAWLASKVPCLADDATAIATADQGVDENPATSPGFGGSQRQRDVNSKYHALHPGPQGGSSDAYMEALRSKAFSDCDPASFGVYLHYLQDSFSHRGFTDPKYGHASAAHSPDKTANDVSRAAQMVVATLNAMIDWSKSCKKCCIKPDLTGQNILSRPEVGKLFNFLRASGGSPATEIGDGELAQKLEILKMQPR